MICDIIIIEDFEFEFLISFKLIVDCEWLEERRIQTVSYVRSLTDVAPLLVLLSFDVQNHIRITFVCEV